MYRVLTALIFALSLVPMGAFGVVNPTTFSWIAPTTNTDGSPLIDLAGFKLHCGRESGKYATPPLDLPVPNATTSPVSDSVKSDAMHFCAISAYDSAGNESGFSNEVNFEINKIPPGAPQEFKVTITFDPNTGMVTVTTEGSVVVTDSG